MTSQTSVRIVTETPRAARGFLETAIDIVRQVFYLSPVSRVDRLELVFPNVTVFDGNSVQHSDGRVFFSGSFSAVLRPAVIMTLGEPASTSAEVTT